MRNGNLAPTFRPLFLCMLWHGDTRSRPWSFTAFVESPQCMCHTDGTWDRTTGTHRHVPGSPQVLQLCSSQLSCELNGLPCRPEFFFLSVLSEHFKGRRLSGMAGHPYLQIFLVTSKWSQCFPASWLR